MPCVTWLICIVQVNGILLLAVQKKIIDKLIIAKDIIVEGSSKILILQKRFFFFYHREGFKSGYIFIKRPTHNSVNDLDDEIGVLI